MFTKGDPKFPPASKKINSLAFLGEEAVFEGKMIFENEFCFDGRFEGKIFGDGKLIIGEKAIVKGKIEINTIIIKGLLEGEVYAKKRVEIHSTGKLYGTLVTPTLIVIEDGILEGHCKMDPPLFS